MVTEGRRWTRDELLLALHLYLRIPFGRQNSTTPEVQELAQVLGRTPSSVAMKLNNLTSLDPDEQARGVRGLQGASSKDRALWKEYEEDPERVTLEAEEAWQARVENRPTKPLDDRATEAVQRRRVRLGQDYFRRVVLANFGGRCALTGIDLPELLTASHIVGWAEDATHRLDPGNGLALNKLHDAAFDQKLVTFDEECRLVLGRRLRDRMTRAEFLAQFCRFEGSRLAEPLRHRLSKEHLRRHREAFAQAER